MSRITVEDCLNKVQGYFELTHLASKRAVQLSNGSPSLISAEDGREKMGAKKEKATVTALREIAAGKVNEDFFNQTVQTEVDQKLEVADWIRQAREKNELMNQEKI